MPQLAESSLLSSVSARQKLPEAQNRQNPALQHRLNRMFFNFHYPDQTSDIPMQFILGVYDPSLDRGLPPYTQPAVQHGSLVSSGTPGLT